MEDDGKVVRFGADFRDPPASLAVLSTKDSGDLGTHQFLRRGLHGTTSKKRPCVKAGGTAANRSLLLFADDGVAS